MVLRSLIPTTKSGERDWKLESKEKSSYLTYMLISVIKIWSLMECFSNTELLLQKGETGQEGTTNHIVV